MRALAAEAGAHSPKVCALPHYDTGLSSRHQILLDILTSFLFSLEPVRHPATTRPRLVRDGIAILYLDLCSSVPCIVPVCTLMRPSLSV